MTAIVRSVTSKGERDDVNVAPDTRPPTPGVWGSSPPFRLAPATTGEVEGYGLQEKTPNKRSTSAAAPYPQVSAVIACPTTCFSRRPFGSVLLRHNGFGHPAYRHP
jgi:hypothetical protein